MVRLGKRSNAVSISENFELSASDRAKEYRDSAFEKEKYSLGISAIPVLA